MSSAKHLSTCRIAITDTALVKSLAATVKSNESGVLFRGAFGYIDESASTANYWVHVIDSASLPSNGTVTHLVSPTKVQHVSGADSFFNVDIKEEFLKARNGVVIAVSDTAFQLTLTSTAIMVATILYK